MDRFNLLAFLLAVFLAFSVWLIHNLSQNYSDLVTVNVWAVSNIEGRAARSAEPSAVVARCSASGFRHRGLQLRRREVELVIDRSELVRGEGDSFSADASVLGRHAQAIFGERVHPDVFLSPVVQFRFPEENHKKVPVRAVSVLGFRPQYMATGPVVVSPDSVVVYGDPRLLASVERVHTRQISLSDIHGSVHGVVRLDAPGGLRLSETEVTYSLEAARYVEIRSRAAVEVRGAPSSRRLSVLPSSVDVVFRCVFPLISDPVGRVGFYVDYPDFVESRYGKCLVRVDPLPDGVIEVTTEPELVECIETL